MGRSAFEGVSDGEWSVFAMKVVAERDALQERVNELSYPRSYLPPGDERAEALRKIEIQEAEERGAAWAIQWFADRGMRHHGAYANAICMEARKE